MDRTPSASLRMKVVAECHSGFGVGNKAIMERIDNPEEIRRLIMERVQRSKLAGLGDEGPATPAAGTWSVEHLRVFRQILEEAGNTR